VHNPHSAAHSQRGIAICLEHVKNKNIILAVSWHGPNIVGKRTHFEVRREKEMNQFFGKCKDLEKIFKSKYPDTNISLLIGGDFNRDLKNIPIDDWGKYRKDFGLCASKKYEASPRRQGKDLADFFVYDKTLTVSDAVPLDMDGAPDGLKEILDHDPVVATWTIGKVKEEMPDWLYGVSKSLYNLAHKVERTDYSDSELAEELKSNLVDELKRILHMIPIKRQSKEDFRVKKRSLSI
jgi:hypothetical protein